MKKEGKPRREEMCEKALMDTWVCRCLSSPIHHNQFGLLLKKIQFLG